MLRNRCGVEDSEDAEDGVKVVGCWLCQPRAGTRFIIVEKTEVAGKKRAARVWGQDSLMIYLVETLLWVLFL